MKNDPTWPALKPRQELIPPMVFHRAIWGKVHGANSDFRWIARSEACKADDGLARDLLLGSEDTPPAGKLYFWRSFSHGGKPTAYVAGTAYLSRAMDAAGRKDFLEKQLLELDAEYPAAAAALLGLPETAAWTDDIWWGQSQPLDWSRHETVLTINEQRSLDPSQLAQAIKYGLDALNAISTKELEEFYARLLAGERPACLRQPAPLSAEALAALLLPLDRTLADTLSMAGWIPSQRYELEELGKRWDIIVLPESARLPALSIPALEKMEQAKLFVQALQEHNPRLLAGETSPESANESFSDFKPIEAQPVQDEASNNEPVLGRETAQLPHNYHLRDPNWPILPDAKLAITPPTKDASEWMRLFHHFASAVDQRVLKASVLKDLQRPLTELTGAEALQLCSWVKQVEQTPEPHYADQQQWHLKLDLLKAIAWILAPSTCVEKGFSVPTDDRLFYYAPALITRSKEFEERWNSAKEKSPDELAKTIRDCLSNTETGYKI